MNALHHHTVYDNPEPPDIMAPDPHVEISDQHDAMEFAIHDTEHLHLPEILAALKAWHAEYVDAVKIECNGAEIPVPDDTDLLAHFLENLGEAVRVGMEG